MRPRPRLVLIRRRAAYRVAMRIVCRFAEQAGDADQAVPRKEQSLLRHADVPLDEQIRRTSAAANAPMGRGAPTRYSGHGAAAGFDYAATGPQLYPANCSACHGASGAGVPGAFPQLAGDLVVTAKAPKAQIEIVLRGIHGKAIGGKTYASQMPGFPQLSDNDLAAIIDHERTS